MQKNENETQSKVNGNANTSQTISWIQNRVKSTGSLDFLSWFIVSNNSLLLAIVSRYTYIQEITMSTIS